MANVYLGCPLYNRQIDFGSSRAFQSSCASAKHFVNTQPICNSLIPQNCNILWCLALNQRDKYQWFGLLHGDCEPEPGYLDALIEEAELHGADFISASIPLKDRSGFNSTRLSNPADEFRGSIPLTQSQVNHPNFPMTFDLDGALSALAELPEPLCMSGIQSDYLLCNTGCMVCRLDRPWCVSGKVFFDDPNGIRLENGVWQHTNLGEDYFFSRAIARQGGKVMATKRVGVGHHGHYAYNSRETWGVPRAIT